MKEKLNLPKNRLLVLIAGLLILIAMLLAAEMHNRKQTLGDKVQDAVEDIKR